MEIQLANKAYESQTSEEIKWEYKKFVYPPRVDLTRAEKISTFIFYLFFFSLINGMVVTFLFVSIGSIIFGIYAFQKFLIIYITSVFLFSILAILHDVNEKICESSHQRKCDEKRKFQKEHLEEIVAKLLVFVYNDFSVNGNLPMGTQDWVDIIDFSGITIYDNLVYDKNTIIDNARNYIDNIEAGIELLKKHSMITEIKNHKKLLKLRPRTLEEYT